MAFTLDLDGLLQSITSIAATITGIRKAWNYDEWPDRPPGLPTGGTGAYHFTGFPGEGAGGVRYILRGWDVSEYEIAVPLYVVVADSAAQRRARSWAEPYFGRYPQTFRDELHLNGTITNGSFLLEEQAIIVRVIPDYPAFDGFYVIRFMGVIHTKGAHTNIV